MKNIVLAALMLATMAIPGNCASYDDLNAAIQYRNLGQWNDAITAFDKALAGNDLVPSQQFIAHLDRGQAQMILKHYDLAIADYSACLALEPDSAPALFQRTIAYLNTGKLPEAASDLDALIARRPMLAAAYNMRAVVNAKLGKADKSAEDSKKILSLLPDEFSRRNIGTGIIAWQAGQIDIAQDNFSYAANHGSGNIYAWLWLTLVKVRMGKDVPRGDLPDFDKKSWPSPIVSFFTGEVKQDTVFDATGQGDDAASQGRICEANFYVGEWLLQHHEPASAQSMIQKAASDCPLNFVEWSPAQVELASFPP